MLALAIVALVMTPAVRLHVACTSDGTTPVGVWFQSSYGIPGIDGVATLGEWPSWTNLTLILDDVLRATPPPNQSAALSVMNTAANLYFAMQVPNQLAANKTDVGNPPYHVNTIDLWMVDGVDRGANITTVIMVLTVEGSTTETEAPYFLGVMPTPFTPSDPSRPYGAATFQPGHDAPRGTYTFELAFPLTLAPPAQDADGRLLNMGLRPVPVYQVIRIFFSQTGHDGNHTYSYSYALPDAWWPPEAERLYVTAAFDPIPWLLIVTGIAIPLGLILLALRRRRRHTHKARKKGLVGRP